jgi:hypothetical protein
MDDLQKLIDGLDRCANIPIVPDYLRGLCDALRIMRGNLPADATARHTLGMIRYKLPSQGSAPTPAADYDYDTHDGNPPDECDQCCSLDVVYPYTTMGYLCGRCRSAYSEDHLRLDRRK